VTRVPARRARAVLALLGGGLAIAVAAGSLLVLSRNDPAARRVPPSRPVSLRLRPDPLAGRAAAFLATRAGAVLAAVYDLDTRQTWTVGQGPPQPEASVVKLDILETLLVQRGGNGPTRRETELARLMIEKSDNKAATDLWRAVGGARGVRSFNAAAGLTRTSPSACVTCAGFPWPGWGLTTTTPADQISLLRQLAEPGPLLSDADRRYVLGFMENVVPSQRWGITAGVSPQATVALKDGWLPLDAARKDWQVNSIGWISGGGRDYLIAVFSTGNPSPRYGVTTIAGLSSIVWENLG
jgi:Beta-lactamase enzyme family